MARLESVAIGGYYKTPEEQIPRIAAMLRPATPEDPDDDPKIAVLDPCAGDGEAIRAIAKLAYPPWRPPVEDALPPGEYHKKDIKNYGIKCDARDHHAEEGCPNSACERYVAAEVREPARLARLRRNYEKAVEDGKHVDFYTCEMEASRHKALVEEFAWKDRQRALRGDAFCADFDLKEGVGLLHLNPPYDSDRGRSEEKFLRRFAPALRPGGILDFVVPHYALAASAETIAKMFERVTCFRFAGEDYDAYKQVVLFGRRREVDLDTPDPEIAARVRAWAAEAPASELPEPGSILTDGAYEIPLKDGDAFETWKMQVVDAAALAARHVPWHMSQRGGRIAPVAAVLPALPIGELMHRTYDVAVPPRPAHIASGLAAGIFNGARIDPDDPKAGLPALLVKGVFDREWRAVDEKHDKHGTKTSEVQVQAPKLVVTILDLAARRYHTLPTGTDKTGAREVLGMGVADLLEHYGRALMTVMERQCRALYDPRRPEDAGIVIAEAGRDPFAAHKHAVRAMVKVIREKSGWIPILAGEIGSGKSSCALLTAMTVDARRPLVVCPPHLLDSWRDEVRATLPRAEFRVLRTVSDVEALAAEGAGIRGLAAYLGDCRARWLRGDPVLADREYDQIKTDLARARAAESPIVAVLSREAAKLGHGYASLNSDGNGVCPRCGAALPEGVDFAKKRARCAHRARQPANACARLARRLALALRPHAESPVTRALLDGRLDEILRERRIAGKTDEEVASAAKAREAAYAGIPRDLAIAILSQLASDAVDARDDGRHLSDDLWRAIAWCLAAVADPGAVEKIVPLVHEPDHHQQRAVGLAAAFLTPERARAVVAALPPPEYSHSVRPADALAGKLRALAGKDDDEGDGTGAIDVGIGARRRKGKLLFGADGDAGAGSLRAALHLLDALRGLSTWRHGKPCGEPLYRAAPEPRRYPLAKYIARRGRGLIDFLIIDECFVAGTKVSGRAIETIRVGDKVDSYDERTGRFVERKVKRRYVKYPLSLVRVSFSDGRSFVCTPNHPVLTVARSWIPAGALLGSELVLSMSYGRNVDGTVQLVQTSNHVNGACREQSGPARVRVLPKGVLPSREERWNRTSEHSRDKAQRSVLLRAHETEQPDEGSRIACSHGNVVTGDGLEAACARWEWAPAADGAATFSLCARMGDGVRFRNGTTAPTGLSEPLQVGHREPHAVRVDRSGRRLSQRTRGSSEGRQEATVPRIARVDAVEVLEPGSDRTFGGVCPDGLVYNLEIEDTHTYVAEGIVVHNCHEYGVSGDSAQSIAAHRLVNVLRAPSIFMTGSIMSGYASSLFPNMISASPAFREEFDRNEEGAFVERYGYKKRVVSDREDGEVVAFGTQSDRVERVERDAGEAPGILPLFIFRHLLPATVTLHKADLRIDLQPLTQERSIVEAEGDLRAEYDRLLKKVLEQIKSDRFKPDLAGKLFGQLAELGSYLDRATVDAWDGLTEYEVRYPEGVPKVGGQLVASARLFPAKTVLPKEAAMLDFVAGELQAGRNTMVFCWHLNLLPRIQRLVEERIGEAAPILWADKVPTGKRQAWINEKVIRKGARVLILNPVCVSTGLNNLVYFASQWHHESPACNAIVDRQSIGRIDRIGQKLPPKVVRAYYGETLQEKMYDLLMAKISISMATDGLDNTGALAAAGLADETALTGLSIGKQLWKMFEDEVEGMGRVIPFAKTHRR